jgi:LacI family transcriptional regulator
VFATTSRPPLTTVDMCLKELGQLAARKLLDDIGGSSSHGLHKLACRLVIRESTGARRILQPAAVPAAPGSVAAQTQDT